MSEVELIVEEAATGPMRRCVAARESRSASGMIRFVVGPDRALVPDLAGRLPGRVLWLSAERRAVQSAVAKNLFAKAGWKITTSSRSYRPSIDDPELDGRFIRAQEVSRYVEHGFFDCGLTGYDWILENLDRTLAKKLAQTFPQYNFSCRVVQGCP